MGPGVPKERVGAIRAAYVAAMKDPEFAEFVRRQSLDLDPIGADELTDNRARDLCDAGGGGGARPRAVARAVTR